MTAPSITNGEAGASVRTKLNNVLASIKSVTDGGEFSYQLGVQFSTLDATVHGSWVFDGTSSYPNKIGVNNTKPVDDPVTGARANDTGYVAGAANVASIPAGYDNVNNALAAHIISQHSMIYSGADHSAIYGGSLHTVGLNAVYAGNLLGTSNTVGVDCDYGVNIGGDQNLIVTGASDTVRGFRGTNINGSQNEVRARNGVNVGGIGSRIDVGGTYGTTLNGQTVLVSANHAVGYGDTVTVSGAYSFAGGNAITVSGARSFAVGDNHTITQDFCSALGTGGVTPFSGAHVKASRNRGGTAGYNQLLEFQCSQETGDTTVTRLSTAGSSTYPTQPADSVVSGTIEVTAATAAGLSARFRINFQSERVGSGTPTLRQNVTTTDYDGIGLGTVPTMNVTTGGIYRVQVVGVAATAIRWNAVSGNLSQLVFT